LPALTLVLDGFNSGDCADPPVSIDAEVGAKAAKALRYGYNSLLYTLPQN